MSSQQHLEYRLALIAHVDNEPFVAGRTYYVLRNCPAREKVSLASFTFFQARYTGSKSRKRRQQPPPDVVIVVLNRDEFEKRLGDREIEVSDAISAELQGVMPSKSVSELDAVAHKNQKITHSDRADNFVDLVRPLTLGFNDLVFETNPIGAIREFAYGCRPQQNGPRLVAKFVIYAIAGFDAAAIAYRTENIGKWDRLSHQKKFGRTARGVGAHHVHPVTPELKEEALRGWETFQQIGRPITLVYRKTALKIWKCQKDVDEHGRSFLSRHDGGAFLTYDQFYSVLTDTFGIDKIIAAKNGYAYFREMHATPEGRYSESVGNFGEKTEADGQWISELAMELDGSTPAPAIIAVRIDCVGSAYSTGIGFSLNGEKADAYKMARLCEAMDKVEFCSYFGMTIGADEWPTKGLSMEHGFDQGVGSTPAADSRTASGAPVVKSVTTAHMGQDKATVEAGHRRSIPMRERPTHIQTNLSVIDICSREIRRVIAMNRSRDASGRCGADLVANLKAVTPEAIMKELFRRCRTDLRPLSDESAIESYMTPVKLQLTPYGLKLGCHTYNVDPLKDSDTWRSLHLGTDSVVPGYSMGVTTRFVLVKVKGTFYKLDATVPMFEGTDQLYVPLGELEKLGAKLAEMKRDTAAAKHAVEVDAASEFEKETGKDYSGGVVVPGRAKRLRPSHAKAKAVLDGFDPGRKVA